jgi:acyl dehydratase
VSDLLWFEDFEVGQTASYGGLTVGEADIVAYAQVFDAQDFHIDPVRAKVTFAGGLIASGWHTSALMMRMMAEGFILGSMGQGAPGIEELKWLRPVRPGDTLSVRHTVLETKESRSRASIGLVRFRFEVLNQRKDVVQEATNWIIFARKGHADPHAASRKSPSPALYAPAGGPPPVIAPDHPTDRAPRFDALAIGAATDLGGFTFEPDDIKAFAAAFDPQRFHLDEAAAQASLFGRLSASGWHTAGVWMRLMVAHRRRVEAGMGLTAPRLGTSPGFRNLAWRKPVFAGDTIRYSSTVVDKRTSASRPEWGLVFHRNSGVNQHGEEVFAFDGCVFWER